MRREQHEKNGERKIRAAVGVPAAPRAGERNQEQAEQQHAGKILAEHRRCRQHAERDTPAGCRPRSRRAEKHIRRPRPEREQHRVGVEFGGKIGIRQAADGEDERQQQRVIAATVRRHPARGEGDNAERANGGIDIRKEKIRPDFSRENGEPQPHQPGKQRRMLERAPFPGLPPGVVFNHVAVAVERWRTQPRRQQPHHDIAREQYQPRQFLGGTHGSSSMDKAGIL